MSELYHHGILGQKWGVRRYQNADGSYKPAGEKRYGIGDGESYKGVKGSSGGKNSFSAKAAGHKVMAKVYDINAKTYQKSNKTLSSMNSAARDEHLKKAVEAQKNSNAKRDAKVAQRSEANNAKAERKKQLKEINPELAKNKQTKRVAYDYHNLDEMQFRRKYSTTKDKFAKRYVKSDGDTYGMGLKKAAVASLINAAAPQPYLAPKYAKHISTGKKRAVELLAKDVAYSEAVSRIGYDKAEQKYKNNKDK